MAQEPQEQCSSCGRFLSRQFVRAASVAPRRCPRCGEVVGGDTAAGVTAVASSPGDAVVPAGPPPDGPAPRGSAAEPVAPSAPPDEPAPHPLDGWDRGATTPPAGTATATPPPPLVGAGVGVVVGLALGRRRRPLLCAALGAALGAGAGALIDTRPR